MVLNDARIYNEGVNLEHDCEEKIRQIVNAIKALSPASDVSFRFLRSGKVFEGLLWGKASDTPIGVYRRGPSMTHVLDALYRQVKKDCLKAWRTSGGRFVPDRKTETQDQPSLAMAG